MAATSTNYYPQIFGGIIAATHLSVVDTHYLSAGLKLAVGGVSYDTGLVSSSAGKPFAALFDESTGTYTWSKQIT
jgi:hypothetical protein